MHCVKELTESLKSLSSSLDSMSHVSLHFSSDPKAYVRTHFNILFKRLPKHEQQSIDILDKSQKSIKEEWEDYQNNSNPQVFQTKRILRLGLETPGLETNMKFQAFVERQDPQKKLYKWLYNFVIRFQALNPDYKFKETFWLELLKEWTDQITEIDHKFERQKLLEDIKKQLVLKNGHSEFLNQAISSVLIEIPLTDLDELGMKISEVLYQKFKISFYSTDYIFQICLDSFFEHSLKQYLTVRNNTESLSKILKVFCDLKQQGLAYKRFCTIFKLLINSIYQDEKETFKSFMKSQLGDPRIEKSNWFTLKEHSPETYKKILYWFNEADFNLFFDFAFARKPDPHGRKECWKRYLPYADDLRIFLPSKDRIEKFKSIAKKQNLATTLEPIENLARLTCFIIKIDNLIIYEAIDTGNASYVYNLNSEDLQNPQSAIAKKVRNFHEEIFLSDQPPVAVNTYHNLAFTDLAPDGKTEHYFLSHENWRFTHDSHYGWHESVRNMMQQLYAIEPAEDE